MPQTMPLQTVTRTRRKISMPVDCSFTKTSKLDIVVGVQVRKLRRLNHITMRDLAKASSISLPTLSRIETGRRSVSLRMLQKLAGGLRVPLRHLLESESPPTSHQLSKPLSKGKATHRFQTGRLAIGAHRVCVNTTNELPNVCHASGPTLVHLARGTCIYRYGLAQQRMEGGDTLLIRPKVRHGLYKALKRPIELIIVVVAARMFMLWPNWSKETCLMVCEML